MPSYSLTLVTILVWTKQRFSAVMQWHNKWKTRWCLYCQISQYLFKLWWLKAIQGETKKWAPFSDDDAEIYMLHKNLLACSDKNFNILRWPSVDALQNISQRIFTLDPIF